MNLNMDVNSNKNISSIIKVARGKKIGLAGKTLYVPGMDYGASRLFCSVFKSFGVNAIPNIKTDSKSIELGAKYTSGEECLPEKVTIGDFMKVVLSSDFDVKNTVFFMPISNGPCRFGQYAPYFKQVLKKTGHGDVNVLSPSGEDGYGGIAEDTNSLLRKAWTALISADILRKMLHKIRPYEKMHGTTDKVFERALERLEFILSNNKYAPFRAKSLVISAMKDIKREFMSIPADFSKDKPLIGVVGEIFCRLNEFSNNKLIRNVEEQGGECWLSDMAEWLWYANWEEKKNQRLAKKSMFSKDVIISRIKHFIQHSDERSLYNVFKDEFIGYEEPAHIEETLELANPYLHADTAIGETVLSVGKTVYLYNKGGDGIIDISPFSCMNGIVSEAVYPLLSKDHEDFPIKSMYFDGNSNTSIERDLPIFMEMARGYMKRKTKTRTYPGYFNIG
jgi:predicted nucleotide-binding protein (sugar kinase/HSP70/actin superfamily)